MFVWHKKYETACDKSGFVLGSTVHPGNEHDSTTFMSIYNKVKSSDTKMIVVDAGYKTPAIAKTIIIEQTEDIRHTLGNKEIYTMRKETIERIFGTVKEHRGFRYTLMKGKAKMEMKPLITFTYINMKKLVKILARKTSDIFDILTNLLNFAKYLLANKKLGYIYIL